MGRGSVIYFNLGFGGNLDFLEEFKTVRLLNLQKF